MDKNNVRLAVVNIIIPVYNNEIYIHECLQSLLNQSYQSLKIIIVNDGSTDNTLAICQKYAAKDSRIKVVNQENGGPGKARNTGLDYTEGPYVMFCDSDDVVSPDLVQTLLDGYENNKVNLSIVGISSFNDSYKEENIFETHNKIPISGNNEVIGLRDYLDVLISNPTDVYFGSNNNKLYDLEFIKQNNLSFVSDSTFAEDLEFNLDYNSFVENIAVVNENLYYYRRDHESSIHKSKREFISKWKRYKIIITKILTLMYAYDNSKNDIEEFIFFAVKDIIYSEVSKQNDFNEEKFSIVCEDIFTFLNDQGIHFSLKNVSKSNIPLALALNFRKYKVTLSLAKMFYHFKNSSSKNGE